MAIRRYAQLALLAALCGVTTGCAASGFGWRSPDQAHALQGAYAQSPPKPTMGSSIAAGIKSTSDKVASALTIKPKVIPAEDPIKLTSNQEQAGPEVYVSAARLYENRGEFEAAAGQYQKALEISPKYLPAMIGQARLCDRQNKFDEANRLYKKAIATHPRNASIYNDFGLCQARQGQSDEALDLLQRAVTLDPASKLYRNNIAMILVDVGRGQEAFEHLVLAHGEAIAHYNLGYLYFQRNDADAARDQFSRALQKDPALAPARDMLGRLEPRERGEELVQRTEHVAEISEPARPLWGAAANPESTPAKPEMISNPLVPAKAANSPAKKSASASLAQRVQNLSTGQAGQPGEEVPAQKMPRHDFPPIRLPVFVEEDEDLSAVPAPLPEFEDAQGSDFGPRHLPYAEDD